MNTHNTHRITLDALDHEVWPAGSDHSVVHPAVVFIVLAGNILIP